MITLNSEDIKQLERINGGTLGTVYKKDNNTAYKIYHEIVYNDKGLPITNPNINAIRLHYKLLLERAKKIKQSGLIKDLIYVDGSFRGVVIPYYNGDILCRCKLSLKRKIDISRQLIVKSKELNNHLIYPTDYKTNNILLEGDNPQLIDLDDIRTHAFIYPSPLFRSFSIRSLGDTIQDFLGQYEYYTPDRELLGLLTRQKSFYPFTYQRIIDYLDEKEKDKIIIFIDKNTDIERLKDYTSTYQYKIVYLLDLEEKTPILLDKLKEYNIPIYDILLSSTLNSYPDKEMIKEGYYYGKDYKLVLKK